MLRTDLVVEQLDVALEQSVAPQTTAVLLSPTRLTVHCAPSAILKSQIRENEEKSRDFRSSQACEFELRVIFAELKSNLSLVLEFRFETDLRLFHRNCGAAEKFRKSPKPGLNSEILERMQKKSSRNVGEIGWPKIAC